ncbi:hypothetical protein BDR22DRAFT_884600 [Usnea florida]
MDSRVVFTIIIVLLASLWYRTRGGKAEPVTKSDPSDCKQILACTGYSSTESKNLNTLLESRAIPNERLVRAYSIDNSFTTNENKRYKDFNKDAGKSIAMTENEWKEVATYAKTLIATKLNPQAVSPSDVTTVEQMTFVTLDSLVRSVCLDVILHVLYKKNDLPWLEMDDESISTIAEKINSLWIESKGRKAPAKSDKRDLQNALAKVIPKWDGKDRRENPLNLILPAYETLWRVVLSGFLQVTFVKGVHPGLRSILAQFLANPTVAAKDRIGAEEPKVCVGNIVAEALRLYPSVKRVYRQFRMDNKAGPEDVAADVESCQRNKTIWGEDADRYDPSRWNNLSDEAKDSYMAFGVKPFLCPAKPAFGPMMIGILVAAFAGQLTSDKWYPALNDSTSDAAQDFDKALNGEKPLVSDRSTYEGIRMIKK